MGNFNYIDSLHSSAGVTSQNTNVNSSENVNSTSSSGSIWDGYSKTSAANVPQDGAAAEKFIKEQEAASLGLKPTANGDYFFDDKNGVYYLWNSDKSSFKKAPNIAKVCDNGNYADKKGVYYTPDGEKYAVVKKGVVYSDDATSGASKYKQQLAFNRKYRCTNNENIYYAEDKNHNRVYYQYDKDSFYFRKTAINDVTANGWYTENGKYFDKDGNEVSKVRFLAGKEFLEPLNDTSNVYKSALDGQYYSWNEEANKFEYVKNDGVLGDFKQGQTGDCWLLAAISAVSDNEKAKELVKNAVTVNDDGSVDVYFKGIDKTYKITADELSNRISADYAAADPDVAAVELAMEKYRQGLLDTKLARGSVLNLTYAPKNTESVLEGGDSVQALQLLTGKKAISISTDGDDKMALNSVIQEGKSFKAALKEYADNPNNVIVVSLKYGVDENGNPKYHAYAFDSYDDENFYLVDPHNTFAGPQPVKKEEFFNEINGISVVDLSSEDLDAPKISMIGQGRMVSFSEFLPG